MRNCRFLDKPTLPSLVAPVPKEDFLACYWEQKPLVVHRGKPDDYRDRCRLRDFDELPAHSPDYIKMACIASTHKFT